jgi:hypothetical protein
MGVNVKDIPRSRLPAPDWPTPHSLFDQGLLMEALGKLPLMLVLYDVREGRVTDANSLWLRTAGWTLPDVRRLDVLSRTYPDPAEREGVRSFIMGGNGEFRRRAFKDSRGGTYETEWAVVGLSNGNRLCVGRPPARDGTAAGGRRAVGSSGQPSVRRLLPLTLAAGVAFSLTLALAMVPPLEGFYAVGVAGLATAAISLSFMAFPLARGAAPRHPGRRSARPLAG